ncbi:hypothetical protein QPK32_07350 [Massilia sp. YIM B02763]|uniref:hypothetical protein n=1 Tax=Massilia sp. YIM B02763 TaxID=3050130 RepID=UPI0025B6AFB9|nr:hypothetical protein [Massilia sp. YIM B02763]MDN4052888.1 hypothetical protein [Massilia sp. YIM B02763]
MGFADRYVHALNATNLKDDERHGQAEPLMASAFAAAATGDLGPLLHRVKFADALSRKAFEGNPANLAQLLRLWIAEVTKRGRARHWVPENTAWDADAAQKLYRQVAEHSLAYWLDGKCEPCGGTGLDEKRACKCCSGTGKAELSMAAGFVREHTLNMVSELHNIADSHAARAASRLRSVR